jgi:Family of unknown function (DUF5397)
MQGSEDTHVVALTPEAPGYSGQIRRFGQQGPAYQVISEQLNGELEIVILESSERLNYSVSDFLRDPIAVLAP